VGAVVSDKRDVLERAIDFSMLRLPGQPMAMHMGTSYLVHDLAAEVRKLRAANSALLSVARDWSTGMTLAGVDPDPDSDNPLESLLARTIAAIEGAEGT
jgi:hypothetical protein